MIKIDDMLLGPEQLPDGLRQKFEDCERRGKNKHVGGQDQCFTVRKNGLVIIGDMRIHPKHLPAELKKKFKDCERKGLNKHEGGSGQDQCFTVNEKGMVILGDMRLRLHPKQLPPRLKKKFKDCERKGKNKHLGGQDLCFTVDDGMVKIDDMLFTPEQLPAELGKKKFEDCERTNMWVARTRVSLRSQFGTRCLALNNCLLDSERSTKIAKEEAKTKERKGNGHYWRGKGRAQGRKEAREGVQNTNIQNTNEFKYQ